MPVIKVHRTTTHTNQGQRATQSFQRKDTLAQNTAQNLASKHCHPLPPPHEENTLPRARGSQIPVTAPGYDGTSGLHGLRLCFRLTVAMREPQNCKRLKEGSRTFCSFFYPWALHCFYTSRERVKHSLPVTGEPGRSSPGSWRPASLPAPSS